MARAKPIDAPDSLERRKYNEMITQVREYRLITPLFGGGVEPGEADPVTVIRASEIRGHLRFWWRATRGGQFGGSLEEMKEAEDLLWGSASKKGYERPSLVQVSIEPLTEPEPFEPIGRDGQIVSSIGEPRSRHSYAAFPLNEKRGRVQTNVSFRLTLSYPKQDTVIEGVQAALWAWEIFSGIGGRTRRGFGALAQKNTNELPSMAEVRSTLLDQMNIIVGTGEWHPELTHLSSESWRLVFITSTNDRMWETRLTHHHKDAALAMWDLLIQRLRDFRQDRPQNGRQFGRSRWPEADALRDHTGMKAHYTDVKGRLHDHRRPSVILNGKPIGVFPRAVFGLPLIFQFKDDPGALAKDAREHQRRQIPLSGMRDPDPTPITIEGKHFRRWASPLILRPLQCRDGVLGLALVLAQPEMQADQLRLSGTTNAPIRIVLTAQEAQQIPMLSGQIDIIRAFLKYLERKN